MKCLLVELFNEIQLELDEKTSVHLKDFLFASMDETRMIAQKRFSKSVLKKTGMDDWEYFRDSIVKREVTNVISYDKQRDHASHTVYNYLIGKYIYKKSEIVKKTFSEHFIYRRMDNSPSSFESIWPFASLLHDIGYIFEGSISKSEVINQNELIDLGSNILNSYFETIFWNECGIDSINEINTLKKLSNLLDINIDSSSIYTISNSLRNLTCINSIIEITNRNFINKHIPAINTNLSIDSFDIWLENLKYLSKNWNIGNPELPILNSYGNPFPKMINLMQALRNYYSDLLINGNKKINTRNIDHGVASGFILLKCSTLYFQILNSILLYSLPNNVGANRFLEKLKRDEQENGFRSEPTWWWNGIIWASLSAAYHNFPLMRKYWPTEYLDKNDENCKLKLEDDPLTYLGLLVDIIQEWDRYSTSFESFTLDELPLQGKDMQLGTEQIENNNKRIVIKYPATFNIEKIKEIKEKLDINLIDWNKIIRISSSRNDKRTIEERNLDDEKKWLNDNLYTT